MLHRLLVLLAALAVVPVALADGPQVSPGVTDGGAGLTSPNGGVRYASIESGRTTVLETIGTSDGTIVNWRILPGIWGIPNVAFDGTRGSLSTDGNTLVLAGNAYGTCTPRGCSPLRTTSRFMVFRPKTLHLRTTVTLKGDFAFDALSPHGRVLYLIQHVSKTNLNRYLVRAYDLRQRALRPGAIADRTQRGWVMQGSPMARATSADGHFVYTLYQNPGGYPFVHALDAVAGTAHCTGVPGGLSGDQSVLGALKLSSDGRRLSIGATSGRMFFTMDTRTYRVSEPGASTSDWFRWWMFGAVSVALLLGAALSRRPWRRALRALATAALK
jgi:hypothetical protein